MKRLRFVTVLVLMLSVMIQTAGCGSNKESWAYNHDPSTEIISLSDNGKAVYKGEKYSYTKDDEFITLKDSSGTELKLRYLIDGEEMTLYEKSTYDRSPEGPSEGLTGLWKQDNGWSFEFTKEGTFAEENIFFGHYTVNEDDSTIKLMYDEPLQDAILYYSLDGDKLTIDYPWTLVHTTKGDAK